MIFSLVGFLIGLNRFKNGRKQGISHEIKRRSLSNLLGINDRNTSAWEMMGDLKCAEDKLSEARDCYQQVLRIKSSSEVQKKLIGIGGRYK